MALRRKKRRYVALLIVFFPILLPSFTMAEETWRFQAFGGTAYNFRMPLVIRQDGADNIRLHAEYDTKAFETPVYWFLRAGLWKEMRSWELELIHHKLHLKNNPPEVEHFSITHGFNLLTVNRAWEHPWFIWRLGGGVVITHPESTVRGKTFDQEGGIVDGYYLSGPTVQIAAEKRFSMSKEFFFSLEGKFTLSWVHVPVKDGNADLWNSAVHGLVGIGGDFLAQ